MFFDINAHQVGDLVVCIGDLCLRNVETGEEIKDKFTAPNGDVITLPEMGHYYIVRSVRRGWITEIITLEEIKNPPSNTGPELGFPGYLFEKVDSMSDQSIKWVPDGV